MKKLLAIILTLAMLSSVMLTGCNTPVETPAETPAESPDETPEETPAHVHVFGEWAEIKAPTCAEKGERERVCECGEKETEAIAEKGHNYASAVTAPTCTEKGCTTHTCTVCGDSYADTYTDPKGHGYNSVVTAPTCTEKGYTTYTCGACGDSYKDTYTDPKGHDYKSVVTAPTVTDKGYTTHTCTVCGDSYVDSYVDPLPTPHIHAFGEWTETKAPTCTAKGERERVCECGAKETEAVDAKGHGYTDTVTAPTCTEQGYTTHTCTVCGDSYKDGYVSAKGHSYTHHAGVAPTCTEKGYVKHTCTVCGDSYKDGYVDAKGHSYPSVVTPPTTSAQGYTTYTCSACGDSYKGNYTAPVTPPAPSSDPTAKGTLWFFEDFEDVALSGNTNTVVSSLGWKILTKSDGAPSNSTANYKIVDHNGSRRLYIENYASGLTAADSYLQILSTKQFNYLHRESYTYQYDLIYADAISNSRYIVLLSEYNGAFYNSMHIRNSGYGNNECYTSGGFKQYDNNVTTKNSGSIVEKVLGKAYTGDQLFRGVSLSVRYVVDWENGNKIYVRDNSSAKGEWVLISKYDSTKSGASYWNPNAGGAGIVLKTGGAQNGYIDNILIWAGTGDEPQNKTDPYLSSSDACHRFITKDGVKLCALCGRTEESIINIWKLEGVPAYDGGVASDDVYLSGQGLTSSPTDAKENRMQLISDTNEAQFKAYLDKLSKNGFAREFYRAEDGNLFASYIKGSVRVYTYFMSRTGEVRVVREDASAMVSLSEFGYSYQKKAGDQTVIYQYAVPLRDGSHFKSEGYIDCGMLYVIKLADNSLIIMDGADNSQFPDTQVDNFMAMLREITGTKDGDTIRIAAWYISHAHGDHYSGFRNFVRKYSQYIDMERVCFAFPSMLSGNTALTSANSGQKAIINLVNSYCSDDDTIFLRLHTGQKFTLADVTIEVVYTHEDVVNVTTAKSPITSHNDSSSVIRFTIDGMTMMMMGDAQELDAMPRIIKNWSAGYLRSDGIQLAHHVLNDLSPLYHIVKAPVLLIPQSLHRIEEHRVCPKPYGAAKTYAREGMIFFENEYTVGLAVVNGEWTKVYTRDVVYEILK